MPTWYETPRSLNQVSSLDPWSPPREKSTRTSASIQKPISNSEISSAVGAIHTHGIGTSQSSSAPPSGSRISVVVIQPCALIEPPPPLTGSSPSLGYRAVPKAVTGLSLSLQLRCDGMSSDRHEDEDEEGQPGGEGERVR